MMIRALILAIGLYLMPALIFSAAAVAAEIKVLSVNGVKLVLPELVSAFENRSGNKVSISLGEAGVLHSRIEKGETFDVAILPKAATTQLANGGFLATESFKDFVRAPFGIAVRRGGPKPDTSSLAGLKQYLLAVKNVVFTDPATGGVSGVFFARVLDDLGIKSEILPKARLTSGVLNAEFVASGEAQMAVQMKQEILAVPGVEFVEFPSEYRQSGAVLFSASISSHTSSPQVAGEFIQFLTSPVARPILEARYFVPAAN
jgi:molybdate transport system substrate-binding protein